ncbi:hypothetical protein C5167_002360 [Papaver somniferum]|uniref:oligopeptidase A n=1 Tax=Papaver somniferum TaxID=3469 RepID=A0A4Y7L1A5_PAPSO|nr:hypothetical protein C5167_002360 [Papaver somniferum]
MFQPVMLMEGKKGSVTKIWKLKSEKKIWSLKIILEDFVFPPFDVVEPKHVRPGIKTLLKQLENDLVVLEKSVEPTWPKLVDPLEKILDRLQLVWGIIDHLQNVKDSADLRSAIDEVQPEKVKFLLRLGQSKPIYNGFKAIQESSDCQALSDSRKRIVQWKIKETVLNGVSLEDDKRERFNEVQQELEKCGKKFMNVTDSTKKFEKLITDKKDIDGLPDSALALAAQIAATKGHEKATAEDGPWMITLDRPSFQSVMRHSRNRSLREELRLEKAKLLGYNNYAEHAMRMATVDKAEQFLGKIRTASWNAAVQDMEDLKEFSREQGAVEGSDLCDWDISFWGERLRESKYDINDGGANRCSWNFIQEELRPYFSLPKVMDGLFGLVKRLFEIDIEAADVLAPVWNDDVRFYRVKDSFGNAVAYFYFDPYFRPSEKQGGAWMGAAVARSRALALDGASARLPVAYVVCNQSPPVGDKPSLMAFREVETVFHEFGHALQHMLTKEDESLVFGFMKNWCYQSCQQVCWLYATPFFTITFTWFLFRAGSLNLRQILFASTDLELHGKYIPGGSESIFDVYRRMSEKTQVLSPLPDDRFLCAFDHIFAGSEGGYAAGYYGYMWAEVLSADAFSAFEDAGLDNEKAVKEIGHKFRDTVLALGGGKPPLEVFVQFRGREPSPEALLRHHGLLTTAAVSV